MSFRQVVELEVGFKRGSVETAEIKATFLKSSQRSPPALVR